MSEGRGPRIAVLHIKCTYWTKPKSVKSTRVCVMLMATCMKLPPTLYAVGANITWTQLSSASKKEQVAVKFLQNNSSKLQ